MADLRPSVVLVGESPPPGAAPDFKPFDCASGQNLVRHLGLASRSVLLEHVPRDNIFHTPGVGIVDGLPWNDADARKRGELLLWASGQSEEFTVIFVALGAKPGAALGVGDLPWYAWRRDEPTGVHVITVPHPSGRASIVTRTPSGPITFRRALLPEILVGCPTLRPWHFTTRIDAIRADLGAALCPYDPAVGVIAATVAAEAHVSPGAMLDIHLAADRLSMLDIIRALAPAPGVMHKSRVAALADLFRVKRGSDLRARVASAEKTLTADYPAEVLRATIGRYTALGVL